MTRTIGRRTALKTGACVALGSLAGCFGGSGPDWSVAALALADGSERWTASITGDVDGGLALADGTVYVQGTHGLWAFAAADGTEQWEFDPDGLTSVETVPTVAGDDVYVAADDRVRCLATGDGSEHWLFETEEGADVTAGPARTGDAVVVGCENGRVYALEAADGTESWRADLGEQVGCGPGVADGTVVVGTEAGRISAFDVAGGAERWRETVPTGGTLGIAPTLVVADGVAYVGSPAGEVVALGTADGTSRWSFSGAQLYQLAVHDGEGYGGREDSTDEYDDTEGKAIRFGLDDGDTRWVTDLAGEVEAAPAVGGDTACYPTTREGLYALETDLGEQQWHFDPGGDMQSSPRTTDDTVFVGLN